MRPAPTSAGVPVLDALGAPYHIGMVVPDIASAVSTLSVVLGTDFTEPQHVEFDEFALEYVFSLDGPSYLELCEGTAGSPWYAAQGIQVHHLGFWSEDHEADAERLVRAGLIEEWVINGSGRKATYLRVPDGFLVELVDASRRPAFEMLMDAAGGVR